LILRNMQGSRASAPCHRSQEAIPIADVLSTYLDAELARLRDRFSVSEVDEGTVPIIRKFKKRIGRLNDWWGVKMLADVDGEQCRKYVKLRGNKGGARRDSKTCVLQSIITPRSAIIVVW
jgi:hypothetical protein